MFNEYVAIAYIVATMTQYASAYLAILDAKEQAASLEKAIKEAVSKVKEEELNDNSKVTPINNASSKNRQS
jgi:hypothetical protein